MFSSDSREAVNERDAAYVAGSAPTNSFCSPFSVLMENTGAGRQGSEYLCLSLPCRCRPLRELVPGGSATCRGCGEPRDQTCLAVRRLSLAPRPPHLPSSRLLSAPSLPPVTSREIHFSIE